MSVLAYRRTLAFFAVCVFFTGLADYLMPRTGFVPLHWIGALAAFSIPLVLTPGSLDGLLKAPTTWWAAGYAALTLVWYMGSSHSAIAFGEARTRLLAVALLWTFLLILGDSRIHRLTQAAILGSVLLGVLLNVVDAIRPLSFSPIPGRAAGLYINPNVSASALVVGMILSVHTLPKKLRPWFVSVVGAGVLLTLSRGGIGLWALVTGFIVVRGTVAPAALLRTVIIMPALVIGLLALVGRLNAVVSLVTLAPPGTWGRLTAATAGLDFSAELRLAVAEEAWRMFLARPLTGYGVGATLEWALPESTHNIYLRHLAEYGVIGAIIIPSLVLAMLAKVPDGGRPIAAAWLAAAVVIWGLFSHNVLDERHFLIAIALVSTMRVASGANTASRSDSGVRNSAMVSRL